MERKTNKKWGRLGSVHHTCMSGNQVDVGGGGGRGQYSNMYLLNLKESFLLVKTSSFNHGLQSKTAAECSTDDLVHCFGS